MVMMTEEEHRLRHVMLHQMLDELLADFIAHEPVGSGFINRPIQDLMKWSHQQTLNPTPLPGSKGHENPR